MRVRDSVAVITGASSGIGRATALAFARKGCVVVPAARREEALRAVARECERHRGTRALAVPTDVTDARAVDDLARRAMERFGRTDVRVDAAAVTVFAPFREVPLDDFRRVLDVNVMGHVHGARAALRVMRERGRGTLVNVSSIVGVVTQPYTHAYGMSKHAVRALGSSLRQELLLDGAEHVHVCTVLPATIDTPLFEHAADHTGGKAVAMPTVHSPERVARSVVRPVRTPRREVRVGPMGRSMVLRSRITPGTVERMMAHQAHRTHLSREEPAPPSHGNLHAPAPGAGAAHGGWGGRRSAAVRRPATATLPAGAAAGVAHRAPAR